ncbi:MULTISPECIES: methionine--tRNA ligase [unclassified Frondihabitans]|uniref:methionine--tRNA ligase n=1 Tax=unclassified Frondihabitans TaxID=2626248 RepID=UPI0006F9AEF6|nr:MULTISPECIES: methionine--tRNA ligase [unclassified Frondihabitans]KQQ27002.1 methionine--tRNA ligase [Frondihabitans sp. Leaf304]RPE76168.1 methionyl-tRNA synthetase [Frondihabitans sp. PhB153]RPF05556.1 methionyl-tRNA synthetase [Frondihabitans sp. PhB161]
MPAGDAFFITTPIFYVNDVPHIGHAYTEVATDVLARWHRQRGDDAWLLTGTDEHGQKILRTATSHDVSPKEWADKLVEEAWIPLLETVNIANDDFIRTTDQRHETGVQTFLQKLYDDGFIYQGEFEGFYCVGCEEYKQASDLVDGTGPFEGQQVCAIHSKPVELLKESNYFFRMSDFEKPLLDLYESQADFIQPESVRNEIVQFVKQGLRDLSISRASFDWGIKVPWDDKHVVYVWFDALLNYVTAVGYGVPDQQAEFDRRWPATHIVGKDIARFHAVIWPAMLMAAGLPVPKHVFGHGWLLVGGEKMSKSKLTGIAPQQITETFGVDAFRYYFMRAITFGNDGNFSWEDISARYQAELANGFGNLASRIIAMITRYFDGTVPVAGDLDAADLAIRETEVRVTAAADAAIERFAIHEALGSIWELVDALNGYITEQEPWALAKDEAKRDRLATVLNTALRGLGTLTVLLSPFIPDATRKLWASIGQGELTSQNVDRAPEWSSAPNVQPLPSTLFPRIEQPEPATA